MTDHKSKTVKFYFNISRTLITQYQAFLIHVQDFFKLCCSKTKPSRFNTYFRPIMVQASTIPLKSIREIQAK